MNHAEHPHQRALSGDHRRPRSLPRGAWASYPEQAFADLRTATSYVRAIGRTALNDSPKRAQFDRPKATGPKRGKKNGQKSVPKQDAANKTPPPLSEGT